MAKTNKPKVKPNPVDLTKDLVTLINLARQNGRVETKATSEGLTLAIHVTSGVDKAFAGSLAALISQNVN